MKMLWCWRCRMEVPMLDEDEFREAYRLYGEGFGVREAGTTKQQRFKQLLDYYFAVTGWQETEPNAIMHHSIALYGAPCEKCGKPYRTSRASFCAACGNKRKPIYKPLTISFDLDDTLIPGMNHFETESLTLFQRIRGIEKIRVGTIDLMTILQQQGHKVFIYTTSLRPIHKIRQTFATYGLRPDKIINRQEHEKALPNNYNVYSKYPPAFGIDVHVDDSEGVAIEGVRYNFKTIIIAGDNVTWADFVLKNLPVYYE